MFICFFCNQENKLIICFFHVGCFFRYKRFFNYIESIEHLSSDSFVKIILSASITSYAVKSVTSLTLRVAIFLDAILSVLSLFDINSVLLSIFKFLRILYTSLVFGCSIFSSSSTSMTPSFAFADSEDNSASFIFFLGMEYENSLGFLAKITPPCLQSGERMLPALARPVPFCFHGFLPEPETSALVFAACVPCLRLALYHSTTSCMSGIFILFSNIFSGNANLPVFSPFELYTFTSITLFSLKIL